MNYFEIREGSCFQFSTAIALAYNSLQDSRIGITVLNPSLPVYSCTQDSWINYFEIREGLCFQYSTAFSTGIAAHKIRELELHFQHSRQYSTAPPLKKPHARFGDKFTWNSSGIMFPIWQYRSSREKPETIPDVRLTCSLSFLAERQRGGSKFLTISYGLRAPILAAYHSALYFIILG